MAISRAQAASAPPGVRAGRVIPNPIAVGDWPLRTRKDGYVLWIGRMAEVKGPHRAIAAARYADVPLVLAGPIQPGQEDFFDAEIAPQVDARRVAYVGEVKGRAKQELFARARAVLMPIRWAEPFGMVMIEALACGTPVISFPEGAATEIVLHGHNGFLAADEREMASAIRRVGAIDPRACRDSVARRYDAPAVAAEYESLYRWTAAQAAGPSHLSLEPSVGAAVRGD